MQSKALCTIGARARCFSTSSGMSQLVKPPIQIFGIDGRYATALYSAASKEKQLEAVEKDLKDFGAMIKKKGTFFDFLLDPSLKRLDKKDLLVSTLAKTKASKLTGNLLGLLAENGRLGKLDGVVNGYATLMSAHRGEVICEVVTAKPLDGPLQQELDAALKSFLKPGQSILLTTRVDPALVGGMVISIADKFVDMSTATKIKKYTALIQAAI